MAEPTPVALAAAPIPTTAEIERAEAFVREEFVHDGEDPAAVLASGSARRRALDGALRELKEKAKHPSTEWRRSFSLLLGLERLLSVEDPRLKDGTVLSAHQVDALSGTLTALLAEAQRSAGAGNGPGRGRGRLAGAAGLGGDPRLGEWRWGREGGVRGWRWRSLEVPRKGKASGDEDEDEDDAEDDEDEGEEDEDLDDEDEDDDLEPVARAAPDEDEDEEDDDDEEELQGAEEDLEEAEAEAEEDDGEEPRDWVDEDEEEVLPEQPEDPNAAKRFWFEHATGAGKTVAALGFVEGSQTGGILILTHRQEPRGTVQRRAAPARLRAEDLAAAVCGRGSGEWPGDGGDLPVVRAQRGAHLKRLHDRDLR